jgi:DNA-binding NarL/FixJ family response regulator
MINGSLPNVFGILNFELLNKYVIFGLTICFSVFNDLIPLYNKPYQSFMNNQIKPTLVIADDHPLFLKGLIAALEHNFILLGIAVNGKDLLDLLSKEHPQIVISDLQMPIMDGLTAAKQIAFLYPPIKTIVLSAFYDVEIEKQLKEAGVKGYITKDVESEFLIYQISQVILGKTAFCEPKLHLQFHINHFSSHSISQHRLSSRELEIISLVRKGLTSEEIGKKLFISINTVEAHRKHIFKKLNLKNIQGMLEFAHKYSL